jgi:hypothetical protein
VISNYDRAQLGQNAIDVEPDRQHNDDATTLTDTLANLMHWAASREISFGTALAMAERHFDEEAAEEN